MIRLVQRSLIAVGFAITLCGCATTAPPVSPGSGTDVKCGTADWNHCTISSRRREVPRQGPRGPGARSVRASDIAAAVRVCAWACDAASDK